MRNLMLLSLLYILLSACSHESVRGAYEAVQQRSCIEQEGRALCEERLAPDYDEYQQQRKN